MKSSGSVMLPDAVAHQAVSVVNSGPIGGLVAARHLGAALGYGKIITADMGGTSFDVGLIVDGVFEEEASPFLGQGLPVHVPTVKVVTIGAGGGSIAWTDGYRLQVGPQSAGAEPGPACYGRGGTEPTVADALVVLGIIDPATFFGGRYALDPAKARDAIDPRIAKPLGLDTLEAAAGIYEVVTAKMADLIRKVTVESGHDPREFYAPLLRRRRRRALRGVRGAARHQARDRALCSGGVLRARRDPLRRRLSSRALGAGAARRPNDGRRR